MSLKQCCATGSLHTGTPTGRIAKVHGTECYIADAPGTPKGIIVIIPDAFGWELPNNRILADEYAKNGFQVYLPEFMQGTALPLEALTGLRSLSATGFWNQIYKLWHGLYVARYFIPFMYYCRPPVAIPRVSSFMKALKANEAKDLPVGTAGFCWGGKFVTELCKDQVKAEDGGRLIECGVGTFPSEVNVGNTMLVLLQTPFLSDSILTVKFVAHPSFLSYPNDIEGIVLPYSCAAAELEDPQMSPEQAKATKEILADKTAKQKDRGTEHEFVMYEGVHHGFAVRADEHELHEAAQGKRAEEQAVKWFSRWFADPAPLSATDD